MEEQDPLAVLRAQLRAEAAAVAANAHRLEPVVRHRLDEDERRRQLWRDSASILIGLILVVLVGQVFLPGTTGGPGGSPTAPGSLTTDSYVPGSIGPPVSLPPGVTFGPIVNPSIGIDRTPTPIPVITMGPTRPPTPSPAPTAPKPSPTKRPTQKPPTPPPPPSVTVSCSVPAASLTVSCTASPSNIQAGSQAWAMGGAGSTISGGNGTNAVEYTYDGPGIYTIQVTVTGLNGTTTASDTTTVTVPGT